MRRRKITLRGRKIKMRRRKEEGEKLEGNHN